MSETEKLAGDIDKECRELNEDKARLIEGCALLGNAVTSGSEAERKIAKSWWATLPEHLTDAIHKAECARPQPAKIEEEGVE